MYPLLVACKSISNLRKSATQEVVDKVRQHSGLLVDQPDTLLQIQMEDETAKDFRVVFDQELGLILKLRDMMIGWIHEEFQSFLRHLNDELLKQEGDPL
ncbi:unnamed protein product [Lactuca saligna]|uniref:Uncharacterized protein n=1 Tax=Lactuca saligna TaxID=75948 RepID=A0AA35YD56_LACSI|nr:unnamed protein product [Lactuca saligna]